MKQISLEFVVLPKIERLRQATDIVELATLQTKLRKTKGN